MGKASRSSSNAARLGLGPDEPDEDDDMYEAAAPDLRHTCGWLHCSQGAVQPALSSMLSNGFSG